MREQEGQKKSPLSVGVVAESSRGTDKEADLLRALLPFGQVVASWVERRGGRKMEMSREESGVGGIFKGWQRAKVASLFR